MAHFVDEDEVIAGLRNLNVEYDKETLKARNVTDPKSTEYLNKSNITTTVTMPNYCEKAAANITTKPISNNTQNFSTQYSESDKVNISNNEALAENSNSVTTTDLNCSLQARNEDYSSVNELAGYFDNLLYIPRKMSPMAEMMYM